MMKWLSDHSYDQVGHGWGKCLGIDVGIDCHFMYQPYCYAYYPMVCFQSGSPSDTPRKNIVALLITKPWLKNSEELAPLLGGAFQALFLTFIGLIVVIVVFGFATFQS
ncbi:MAG: hypothetical protein MUF68_03570, partial [Cyclobacteriaceae bacterium]|nr:hypothetical protein [Cyclobacteriaceae bacterium]